MPHIGLIEIGLIVFLVLIVFGAGRLPQVFGGFGKAVHEFRQAKELSEENPVNSEKQVHL